MNSESIYDALTDIREDFITGAREHRFAKLRKPIIRWGAIAAVFALAIGLGSLVLMNTDSPAVPGGNSGGGGGSGSGRVSADGSTVFMSYAGPVFPLSVLGEADGISASREIVFDFSGFDRSGTAADYHRIGLDDISITDSYTLTNNTDSDKTVQIIYPFAGSFYNLHGLLPVISADGNVLETELKAGAYSGGFTGTSGIEDDGRVNLRYIDSWEGYTELLSDGGYLSRALGDFAVPDMTVTVYEFSNIQGDHDQSIAPTLAAMFNLNYERTTVMTYNFNGGLFDRENGFMRRSFFVGREGFAVADIGYYMMIVLGDDIDNLVIQGYENGGCHPGEEVDHVSADVARYETDIGDILKLLHDDYMEYSLILDYNGDDSGGMTQDAGARDMLFRAALELLSEHGLLSENAAWRYDTGELIDIFQEARTMDRVFYLTAEIEIPAGESVAVSAVMNKPGSFDFYGSGSGNVGLTGYDMMTTLGSNLVFTDMAAGLVGAEMIDIVNQNFGFDPESGVLNVTLDIEVAHYYLEVKRAALN